MKPTYRAMQVTTPGMLELVERMTPMPRAGEALIAVEGCGICGADAGDIDGADPTLKPPRVPGHEIVGRIVALGDGVPALCSGRSPKPPSSRPIKSWRTRSSRP